MPEWLRHGAVYQVYPRSYQDSDGDGIGDLPGLLTRLDHLQDLGVAAVWLSPVHPSPQADFGYDIADYCGVDPLFGTLEDLDAVIAGCHARGMKLILDGVFNHSSDQHPWFQESRKDLTNPKRDWYLWRDGRSGRAPNNWASTFGGSAWTVDPATGQSYLHSFLPSQPDLNWRNPEVVAAVLDVLRFWFQRGVDGFRLDVFNCYRKHPDLPDNPRRWHPGGLVYGYIGQHHVHDRDQADLVDVLGQMRAVADEYGAALIGETLDENFRYEQAHRFVGPGLLHQAFHFALLHSRWRAPDLCAAIARWVAELGPEGWPTWVLSNHDFPRHPTRWGGGDARAKAAAVLSIGLRGTPYLYYGEELGLPETRLARADIVDPPGKRFWPFFKGRDGARTPMPWDGSAGAGFSTGTPWLPLGPDHTTRNVMKQQEDPRSVLSITRAMLNLRAARPALRAGAMPHLAAHGAVLVWTREVPGERLLLAVNTAGRPAPLRFGEAGVPSGPVEVLLRTGDGALPSSPRGAEREVLLGPDEAVVLALR